MPDSLDEPTPGSSDAPTGSNSDGQNVSGGPKYESLDYDLIENVLYLEERNRSRFSRFIAKDLQRWIAVVIIGIVTAMSAFFALYTVNTLTGIKFSNIIMQADQCSIQPKNSTSDSYAPTLAQIRCISHPVMLWIAWNVVPVTFGALIVTYFAPVAAGSGIPVVKCYLNGVNIPDVVRLKTFICKLLGVVSSVVGGLAVGKEGPFIHCGAAIGAGVSQGFSHSIGCDTGLFKEFRNDRDKRDFVAAGASSGVAAAFGAPIGGVLFSLEEGASFWNQALTWRIFLSSMSTSFILDLVVAAYNHQTGIISFSSLVNFGLVEELDYFWFEVPIYLCIAAFGGIIGASYCKINLEITKWRQRQFKKQWIKVCEAAAMAAVTAIIGCIVIFLLPDCQPFSPETPSKYVGHFHNIPRPYYILKHTNDVKNGTLIPLPALELSHEPIKGHVVTFLCPPGHYSAMSTLWLKTSEGASSTFMTMKEEVWSIKTLFCFFICYFVIAVVTYGLSVSAGVFIPSLLIGATFGRLIGAILNYYFGPAVWLSQPNKFAIIGAASVLGGVVRMTISLTVIIIEATGCISFGLPIMLSLMVSKWVGDYFIEGLYDIAIHLAKVPFLGWEPPERSCTIYASEVMSKKVTVLKSTEKVRNIVDVLINQSHNGFPVVDLDICHSMQASMVADDNGPATHQGSTNFDSSNESPGIEGGDYHGSFQEFSISSIHRESYGRLRGLILRWQLITLLENQLFNQNERSFDKLKLSTFRQRYPHYLDIQDVLPTLEESMMECTIDLRSIMNPSPYSVIHSSSLRRIYQLFRSLGLRHLVVTDDRNNVVGMVTRKDLAKYECHSHSSRGFMFKRLSFY